MTDLSIKGMVADIQRFSLHDGPGIRTTVFLKGCNMHCPWCHNPETIAFAPQMLLRPDKCIGCGKCAEGCFSGARKLCGVERTVGSVMEEILLDKAYYGIDGGVTISGGEPLCQPVFTTALLQACRDNGIGTALESNMAAPWETAEKAMELCGLLMCDLKLWDSRRHRQWTGMPNEKIKKNILRAAEMGVPVLLRTPVVPGVNNDIEEIKAIARFAATLPTLVCYELLPYHKLGLAKGALEGFEPQLFEQPSAEEVNSLAQAVSSMGVAVRIAGRQIMPEGENHV